MKKSGLFFVLLFVLVRLVYADRLDEIQKLGVLRVACLDSNPPFGFLDKRTHQITGLDVDMAQAIADRLKVKLFVLPTNTANRVALLTTGKADLIAANFTITPERRQQIDFSIPYFATKQGFIARAGTLSKVDQLNGLRIGVDKGTTQEINLRKKYPQATVIAYDNTPLAFAALRNRHVQAISQDDAKLLALLAKVPDKEKYELVPFVLAREFQALGLPKHEARFAKVINESLFALEQSGEAERIYQRWFGPNSKAPLTRSFKIGDATTQ